MSKIIAITGTHGTGKTTLTFALAMHYKHQGANVKIIQEVARSCPFPLNDKMTRETALWIYHEHSKKELEARKDHDIVICDRTAFDSFVYAESLGIMFFEYAETQAKDHLYSYDKLFFIRPDIPLIEDGIRSNDVEFQMKVDKLFEERLYDFDYIEMKSSAIFDKDQSWKQYC
jgi:thymidylate kinase